MKTVFFFACFLFFLSANSQIKFGVRGGVSFSNRDGSVSNSTDLITINASVFAIDSLSKTVIVQPSLGYHPKGNKYRNLTFSDPLGTNTGYGDVNFRFDNIELTVPFQYMITSNKDRKLFLGLGPYFSYALGGTVKWKNVSGQVDPPPKSKITFTSNGEKRVDAGINLLLTFQVDKHWTLNVDFDRSMIAINQTPYSQQSKLYSHSEGLAVGYIFK